MLHKVKARHRKRGQDVEVAVDRRHNIHGLTPPRAFNNNISKQESLAEAQRGPNSNQSKEAAYGVIRCQHSHRGCKTEHGPGRFVSERFEVVARPLHMPNARHQLFRV